MITLVRITILSIICVILLCACAHTPQHNESAGKTRSHLSTKPSIGQNIAELAKTQLGKPYKYGGSTPGGFDCSGLVYYTHSKLGIRTPRTSLQQYQDSTHIKLDELHAGDLVFFRLNKSKVSHVGIYIGNGRFIHAPKSGKRVSINYLSDDYWEPRIVSGGRLH